MYKILTTVVLSGILLAGCAGTSEQSAVEDVEATEEVVEEVTESSVFVDDIQTTFTVERAKSPTITEEEKAIGQELSDHVNHSTEHLTDRDHVKNASANYPNHTYEELYDIYSRYYEDIFHGDKGEYYTPISALFDIYFEVIENNIVAGVVTSQEVQLQEHETGNELKITGDYGTIGQPDKITMWFEIDEETSKATLVRLAVDDEEAIIK